MGLARDDDDDDDIIISLTEPGMDRPGAPPHWSKVGAGRGCEKQSALDTWASCHLNP